MHPFITACSSPWIASFPNGATEADLVDHLSPPAGFTFFLYILKNGNETPAMDNLYQTTDRYQCNIHRAGLLQSVLQTLHDNGIFAWCGWMPLAMPSKKQEAVVS
jgi:hypothetical protein